MALATATELKEAWARVLARADLATEMDDAIVLVERPMDILLHRREMAVRSTASTVAGQQNYALPTAFGDAIALHLSTSPVRVLTPSDWSRIRTVYTTSGEPREYAIVANEFVLGPTPDAVYTLDLYYYRTVPSLISNSTNWLLSGYPNIYYYGGLAELAAMLDHPNRDSWSRSAAAAVWELKKDQVRERGFGGGPFLRADLPFGVGRATSILTDE